MDKISDDYQQRLWFMLVGWIGSTLAVFSIVPNIVIVAILSRNKITSNILVNFRSCACADILCAVLFLLFICPSWFQDKMAFNTTTCIVGGVVSKWAGFVLNYSLVYLMFQRYSQSRKEIGWKESKFCFVSPIFIIWLIFGAVTVLPYAHYKTPYSYNPNFSTCTLSDGWMSLSYDVLHYAIPSLLLFIAGTLLNAQQSKPIRKIKLKTPRINSVYLSPRRPQPKGCSVGLSPGRYIQIEDISTQYPTLRRWNWKKMNTSLISSIENHLLGLETRLSFIFISYTSCIFIIITFIFRLYGTFIVPTSKIALSASHIFTFAAGITRSVIPLLVSEAARNHLSKRSSKTMRTSKNINYLKHRVKNRAPKRKLFDKNVSEFVSFSLFMRSTSECTGTHCKVGKQEMEDFWFKDNIDDIAPTNTSSSNYVEKTVDSQLLSRRRNRRARFPQKRVVLKGRLGDGIDEEREVKSSISGLHSQRVVKIEPAQNEHLNFCQDKDFIQG